MDKIDIKLINCDDKLLINELGDILNGLQNLIKFNVYNINLEIEDIISWEEFKITHQKDNYSIYITKNKLDDNWFSHNEKNFALISYFDWDELYAPPHVVDYLLYQISLAITIFFSSINERTLIDISHTSAIGCLMDACSSKDEIIYGMKSGLLCQKCISCLREYRIQDNQLNIIKNILNYVRNAFTNAQKVNYKGVFIVMKFDNNKIYEKIIEPTLTRLGLKCSRADKEYNDNTIYQNVIDCINSNRFVVVLLSNNKNVYFEYGYAIALKKDILVLKKKNVKEKVASDINNHIFYEYDESNLSELVESFFRKKYSNLF